MSKFIHYQNYPPVFFLAAIYLVGIVLFQNGDDQNYNIQEYWINVSHLFFKQQRIINISKKPSFLLSDRK